MARALDVFAWAMFCGSVIAWLFVGPAWASDAGPIPTWRGELLMGALVIAAVIIAASWAHFFSRSRLNEGVKSES